MLFSQSEGQAGDVETSRLQNQQTKIDHQNKEQEQRSILINYRVEKIMSKSNFPSSQVSTKTFKLCTSSTKCATIIRTL